MDPPPVLVGPRRSHTLWAARHGSVAGPHVRAAPTPSRAGRIGHAHGYGPGADVASQEFSEAAIHNGLPPGTHARTVPADQIGAAPPWPQVS